MKKIAVIVALASLAFAAPAVLVQAMDAGMDHAGMDRLGAGQTSRETGHDHRDAQVYICAMHPFVVQEQPGSCPICGMTLVKKGSIGSPSGADTLLPETSKEEDYYRDEHESHHHQL